MSHSGMVETPRLQAKIKTAIWPKAMSQHKLDKNPYIFSRFQPIYEPTVFQTLVVQLSQADYCFATGWFFWIKRWMRVPKV